MSVHSLKTKIYCCDKNFVLEQPTFSCMGRQIQYFSTSFIDVKRSFNICRKVMAQENQRFKFKVKFSSEKAAREADQSHEYSKTTLSIRKFNFLRF